MRRGKLLGGIALAAVAMIAVVSAIVAWRAHQKRLRLEALETCLLGEPLAPGEKASARMLRLELARPFVPLKREGKEWVPIDPTPTWPSTCASLAAIDAPDLAELLGDNKADSAARRAAADAVIAPGATFPSGGGKPWLPVVLLEPKVSVPEAPKVEQPKECPIVTALTEDQNRKRTLVTGYDGGSHFETTVVSRFEDSPDRFREISPILMNCKGDETRVTWAWATSINAKATEEIATVTCHPSGCSAQTAIVHVETSRHSNCGYCAPPPDRFSVVPPLVIDLFSGAALVWSDGRSVRVRVAPAELMDTEVDTVVWYVPDLKYGYFEPQVLARNGEAFLHTSLHVDSRVEGHVFEVVPGGARERTP